MRVWFVFRRLHEVPVGTARQDLYDDLKWSGFASWACTLFFIISCFLVFCQYWFSVSWGVW
ncbi:formamidopyrimidine-DNA glycosylase [Mobiluncus mulieris]|uniref:Uncharacterized protein n=2 Tax=Mobiluncus mulieris TaxID=2052 RepID=E0QS83_9ACTO|nr:hypothetical protein HMPREF0577_1089 [Mobiluncus mulieris ATCC 35243]EFM45564.1 hypothetical protein HMPREF0580_1748 [Mobiluncus mulieris ATCC 35239]MCU9972140.1 formamidopyrimidine-DNA glycosylase [Mobiluncus mulieris]MCU9976571.1 formamidopyrimidine-DNA glycosylase [Mobiluncus mulieris]MCU9997385.1 formamidopyrimidine-DNA glycosylase [Mobiluncus mulieris]